MNAAEMTSMVSQMLGDTDEQKVFRGEILAFLNMGQAIVGGVLSNIERERFMAIGSTVTGGNDPDSEYELPDDLRHIIKVTVKLGGAGTPVDVVRWPLTSINALLRNTTVEPTRGTAHYFVECGGRSTDYNPGKSRIRFFPSYQTNDDYTIYYVKMHTEFRDLDIWPGTLTSVGTINTLTDSALPLAGGTFNNGETGAWIGAEVVMKTGITMGQRSRVTGFTPGLLGAPPYGVLTISPALGQAPENGTKYRLAMVSVIPPQHHHLICYYAAAMAAPKAGLDPGEFMGYFEDEMERMRKKWLDNITANVPGQIQMAPRRATVEG